MKTTLRVPAGATDTHVHVFDPAHFPYRAGTPYQPVAAETGTASDLATVLDASGIERVVLVNPTSGYGDDNRCMLDALERLGARARGIARVPLAITGRALDALAKRNVVGVRVDFIATGGSLIEGPAFPKLLARLAERDLVCDIQAEGEQWSAIAPALAQVPVRIVIDHAGRPRPELGLHAEGFKALLGLADNGRTVVKLSGPTRYSLCEPPYGDVDRFVTAIVRAFTPQRLVWGSDWPFLRERRRIDYAPMLAQLARGVPDARDRRTILAVTPQRWFGFS